MKSYECIGGPWDGFVVDGVLTFDDTGKKVRMPGVAGAPDSKYAIDHDTRRLIYEGLRARKKEQT